MPRRENTMNTKANDEAALKALFTQFLDGWNAGRGEAFAAPFTEIIDFIGFDGTYFTDRTELAEFHQTLFDKWLKGSRLVGDMTVRFLTPDAALLVAHGGTIMRGKSKPSPVRDSIQTLTAVRTPDGWRLASFQNTRLRPMGASRIHTVLWLLTDLIWKVAPNRKSRTGSSGGPAQQ
jgi:uncharacterized protein (TIGR02246 family)